MKFACHNPSNNFPLPLSCLGFFFLTSKSNMVIKKKMVVMALWMHLVLVNNNIIASSSDEKTLSSFLLYLRAYSLDGVSIGTAFFSPFPLLFLFSFSSSSSFKHIYTSRAFSFSFSSAVLARSIAMLDDDADDVDHFACNFYCLLFSSLSPP